MALVLWLKRDVGVRRLACAAASAVIAVSACGGSGAAGRAQHPPTGVVIQGAIQASFPATQPGTCQVLQDLDAQTPGQTFEYSIRPSDGQFPILWVHVYPYRGPSTYALTQPMPNTAAGTIAGLTLGIDTGYQNARGSVAILTESADTASGSLDISRMDSSDPPGQSIKVSGAWQCRVTFRGHPSPPPLVHIP